MALVYWKAADATLRMRMQTWEWGIAGEGPGKIRSLKVRHARTSVLEIWMFSNSAGWEHRLDVGLR